MRKMLSKVTAGILLSSILLAACSGGNTGTASNKFVVGMECDYAPYNWTTPTKVATAVEVSGGQYCDGFDVVVAQKVAEGLGKELVIEKTSWDGLIPSLQTNQIDAIIAGMSPTEERKQEINFSDVYYRGKFGVVVKKDSAYANAKTVNDLAGAKMTAQLGTFHVDLLPQFAGATALPPMKDFPTMTVATKAGEVDAFVSDNATGPAIAAANDDLVFVLLDGPNGLQVDDTQTGVGIGLRKSDTELTAEVNKVLGSISEEEMQAIMDAATERQPKEN